MYNLIQQKLVNNSNVILTKYSVYKQQLIIYIYISIVVLVRAIINTEINKTIYFRVVT